MATHQQALPHEVEKMIFDIAADESSQAELVVYMLVARRLHAWMMPCLFQMIVLPRLRFDAPIPTSLRQSIAHRGHYVRYLVIGGCAPSEDIAHLLHYTPKVERLFFWCKGMGPEHQKFLDKMPLQQLSCHMTELFPFNELGSRVILEHNMFSELTMLEITTKYDDWDALEGLTLLPKLRYLALMAPENNAQREVYRQASRNMTQIKILLSFNRDVCVNKVGKRLTGFTGSGDDEGWGDDKDPVSLQEAGLEEPDEYDYSLDFGKFLHQREDIDSRMYEFHIKHFFLIPGDGLWEKIEFVLGWMKAKGKRNEGKAKGEEINRSDEEGLALSDSVDRLG